MASLSLVGQNLLLSNFCPFLSILRLSFPNADSHFYQNFNHTPIVFLGLPLLLVPGLSLYNIQSNGLSSLCPTFHNSLILEILIIGVITGSRIRLLGHAERTDDRMLLGTIYKGNPSGRRSKGWPEKTRLKDVIETLKYTRIGRATWKKNNFIKEFLKIFCNLQIKYPMSSICRENQKNEELL